MSEQMSRSFDRSVIERIGRDPEFAESILAELSASQAREAELREKLEAAADELAEQRKAAFYVAQHLAEYKQRAEAAEARIKASQEQEPHHWLLKPSASNMHVSLSRRELSLNGNFNEHWQIEAGYYAQPQIPPELAELQRTASNATFDLLSAKKDLFQAQAEVAELRKQIEESRVPEGWKLVPKEPTEDMVDSGYTATEQFQSYTAAKMVYYAMLNAAPQPKEPKQ